jgi:hypothetical protein
LALTWPALDIGRAILVNTSTNTTAGMSRETFTFVVFAAPNYLFIFSQTKRKKREKKDFSFNARA